MNRNKRFILMPAFGMFPSKYVERDGKRYEYAGYVHRRGITYVRWNRKEAA